MPRSVDRGQPAAASLAPTAFFVYRRPWTTLQALYALSRCPEAAQSELHVFSDGARSVADSAAVAQVREVVRFHRWCGKIAVHESERNLGLARSVIEGVRALCASHGRVIVVEDDLLVASGFLEYMNRGLDLYRDEPAVMQISGHSFPAFAPEPRAVLMPLATTWGWATWERAWSKFEEVPRNAALLRSDRGLRHSFDLDGAYPYSRLLERQLARGVDSWGIRWWWSVHQHRGLGLFPLRTLVRNIGFGGEATHTRSSSPLMDAPHWLADASIREFPAGLQRDEQAFQRWKQYIRSRTRPSLGARIGQAARSLLVRGMC
jgi:hypothetical protein